MGYLSKIIEVAWAVLFALFAVLLLPRAGYALYAVSSQAYYDFKNKEDKCVEELKPATGCPHRNHSERLLLTGAVYCRCP